MVGAVVGGCSREGLVDMHHVPAHIYQRQSPWLRSVSADRFNGELAGEIGCQRAR